MIVDRYRRHRGGADPRCGQLRFDRTDDEVSRRLTGAYWPSGPAIPGGTMRPWAISCDSFALAASAPWSSTPEPAAREMESPPRPRRARAQATAMSAPAIGPATYTQ